MTGVVAQLRSALANMCNVPAGEPMTMPPVFYTSAEFLELEKEVIFRQEWICVARMDEIPAPGNFIALDIVGEPILVIRGDDGVVRVLSNVCRHRGTRIMDGRGTARRLVCPYHAWAYATDGRLLGAPHMAKVPSFDAARCRLPGLASEVWQGFIYVNLDGKAPPLAPRLVGLEPLIRNYHLAEMTYQHGEEEIWAVNWKSLAENFMEGYHLSVTHPRTLHPITPTSLCKKIPGGLGYTGYKSHYNTGVATRQPFHSDLTAPEQRRTMMFWVYPSHVVALAPNSCTYMSIQPGTTSTAITRWGFATVDPNPSVERLEQQVGLVRSYNAEDRATLERLQRGISSRFAAQSCLGPSDLEGTVWDFYGYMARTLAASEATGQFVPMPEVSAETRQ